MASERSVLRSPVITEKATALRDGNTYTFRVDVRANKIQIKSAIEKLYGVKVDKVRTCNRKGKMRRRGRAMGQTRSWKKAVVFLKDDHHIDLF